MILYICLLFIPVTFIQERTSLALLDYISSEQLKEHIGEMKEIHEFWTIQAARHRRELQNLEENIEQVWSELFRTDRKELAEPKK